MLLIYSEGKISLPSPGEAEAACVDFVCFAQTASLYLEYDLRRKNILCVLQFWSIPFLKHFEMVLDQR